MSVEEKSETLVLVADDDADIRELVRYRLEQAGYRVIAAADGREALELAEQHHPDLVLLDVMMPHLDGFEVTRRLRKHESLASVPVVLLSASMHGDADAASFESGANAHMLKPFAPAELLKMIDEQLPGD